MRTSHSACVLGGVVNLRGVAEAVVATVDPVLEAPGSTLEFGRGLGVGAGVAAAMTSVGGCICKNQTAAPTIPSTSAARMITRRVFIKKNGGDPLAAWILLSVSRVGGNKRGEKGPPAAAKRYFAM